MTFYGLCTFCFPYIIRVTNKIVDSIGLFMIVFWGQRVLEPYGVCGSCSPCPCYLNTLLVVVRCHRNYSLSETHFLVSKGAEQRCKTITWVSLLWKYFHLGLNAFYENYTFILSKLSSDIMSFSLTILAHTSTSYLFQEGVKFQRINLFRFCCNN